MLASPNRTGQMSFCLLWKYMPLMGRLHYATYMPLICHVYATYMPRICHVYATYMPLVRHVYETYMPLMKQMSMFGSTARSCTKPVTCTARNVGLQGLRIFTRKYPTNKPNWDFRKLLGASGSCSNGGRNSTGVSVCVKLGAGVSTNCGCPFGVP